MNCKQAWSILHSHKKIGWDIDETLLSSPVSASLFNFIERNPEKKHHLVTFRNGKLLDSLRDELENARPGIYEKFTTLHTLPENIVWDKSSRAVREFKPNRCVEFGLTVLVDDITWLEAECNRVGVVYLNPLCFLSSREREELNLKL